MIKMDNIDKLVEMGFKPREITKKMYTKEPINYTDDQGRSIYGKKLIYDQTIYDLQIFKLEIKNEDSGQVGILTVNSSLVNFKTLKEDIMELTQRVMNGVEENDWDLLYIDHLDNKFVS